MRTFILSLVFIIISTSINAQSPDELIKKFFNEYEEKGANNALDNLYATNKWMNRNQDAIQNLQSQLANLQALIGEYYGYEFITKKSAGSSFVLYSYLAKYDRQPIRFTFKFYKPDDKWMIFSFAYDENIDDELVEAAKAYRLPENYEKN